MTPPAAAAAPAAAPMNIASSTTSCVSDDDNDDKIVVLKRTVKIGSSPSSPRGKNNLSLLFLGSESQPPYGPYQHTATLFLDLICRAVQQQRHGDTCEDRAQEEEDFTCVLRVYRTSELQFPSEDDLRATDGVILPGSYNSAYEENTVWITQLKQLIQTCLVPQKIPTLGVCFGHQIMAQSFEPNGSTTKCPAGSQAGRKSTELTVDGKRFLQQEDSSMTTLDLYYSHGDMVAQLPPNAVSLGGNDKVPIQAAVYYDKVMDGNGDGEGSIQNDDRKVIAVTFQAHPEYGSSKDLGLEQTVLKIIRLMSDRGDISNEDCKNALDEAKRSFEDVERQSIAVMTNSGKLLGWF